MRTLILSDIHGNLPALQAILEVESDFNRCLFLGDVVDYGPFPKECIAFLDARMTLGVLGNHDNAIARNADCGCRDDFLRLSEETRAWQKPLLGADDLEFLRSLSPTVWTRIEGKEILLAHASPHGNIFRYIHEEEMEHAVAGIMADFILLGHTHVQFQRQFGPLTVVNPGSVGLARDGGQACYAVLCDGSMELKRIAYDVERTIEALREAPISAFSINRLTAILRGQRV